jgi:hypothetical protein
MPPTHSLLRAKNSVVAGFCFLQFEQVFIGRKYTISPVWWNQTDKFGGAA